MKEFKCKNCGYRWTCNAQFKDNIEEEEKPICHIISEKFRNEVQSQLAEEILGKIAIRECKRDKYMRVENRVFTIFILSFTVINIVALILKFMQL